jgi:hypothetical protein
LEFLEPFFKKVLSRWRPCPLTDKPKFEIHLLVKKQTSPLHKNHPPAAHYEWMKRLGGGGVPLQGSACLPLL